MKLHPLKLLGLLSIVVLIVLQLGIMLWSQHEYRVFFAIGLAIPLLLPIKGLLNDKLYTYKWTGFLTLFYLCIGVSEAFANPQHRLYSSATIVFSGLLYISSIYYVRLLRLSKSRESEES